MKTRLLQLLLLAFAGLASIRARSAERVDVSPAQPIIPNHTLNLADFGAIGDGKASNTKVFKAAITAVEKAGGGTLVVPAGVFLTGPFPLCSGLNLHLDSGATVLFSSNIEDYRSTGGSRLAPQILARSLHDVMISGSGTIDGQGGAWWAAANAARDPVTGQQYTGHTTPRPSMLIFAGCQRVRVEGVRLQNSPGLNLGLNDCDDETITGISIQNPANSPNTDGIDPKGGQRILISHCRIDTGDDCIALGGSSRSEQQDILVTDCTFLHGHGCSIGSGTSGGVRRLVVRHCTFDGTETGVRLKSARGRGGPVEDLLYEDLAMVNVGRAISLNSHYQGTTVDNTGIETFPEEPVNRTTPRWNHIVIRNLTARACTRDAGLIVGLPEMPAQDIVLEHISIEAPAGLQIAYVSRIELRDVSIKTKSGPPLIVAATVQGLSK